MNIHYYQHQPRGVAAVVGGGSSRNSYYSNNVRKNRSYISSNYRNNNNNYRDMWIVKVIFMIITSLLCIGFLIAHWLPPPTSNATSSSSSSLISPQRDFVHPFFHNNRKNQQHPGGATSPRIAILLPYSSGGGNKQRKSNVTTTIMPSYMLTFCAGAAGAGDSMDFFIFYFGVLDWPDLVSSKKCPDNVYFINLGPTAHHMAHRLLKVVDNKYNNNVTSSNEHSNENNNNVNRNNNDDNNKKPVLVEYDELLNWVSSYIQINPYGLVEFKPALGYIFQDYLNAGQYTHWGYTDLDILFGDISRWIISDYNNSNNNDNDIDIVTYTFGDQNRLYLRGQLTIHKNDPTKINQLWRYCTYLSNIDERFYNFMNHKTKYHVESAEGCYSAAILNRTDITVKYVVRAWTDIHTTDTAYTNGIYFSFDQQIGKQVLYKKRNKVKEQYEDEEEIDSDPSSSNRMISSSWFFDNQADSVYNNLSIPLQRPIGALQHIDIENNLNTKGDCGLYWILPQYRTKLCLQDGIVTSDETIYWKHGQLYKQSYENTMDQYLPADITTGPFFHFQEWKRKYRYGQLTTFYPSSMVSTTVLTPEGAIPLIDNNKFMMIGTRAETSTGRKVITKTTAASSTPNWGYTSPLGHSDMKVWHGVRDDDRSQLPGHIYCLGSLESHSSNGQKTAGCQRSISWHNKDYVHILLGAPSWADAGGARSSNTEPKSMDVTLVLTLEIMEPNHQSLQNMIYHLTVTLRRWQGQPCVVVIYIAGAPTEGTIQFLRDKLTSPSEVFFDSTLVAVICEELTEVASPFEEQDHPDIRNNSSSRISRKALLNMAIDAVPTRWYVSGIELERGLSISIDTAYFAHRVSTAHSRLRGNVFWIPQFGLINDDNGKFHDNESDEVVEDTGSNGLHTDLTLKELVDARGKGNVRNLSDLDDEVTECTGEGTIRKLPGLEDLWWIQTKKMIDPNEGQEEMEMDTAGNNKRAVLLEELERTILELTVEENFQVIQGMDESPILLIDNLGPSHDGIIKTNEIVREVEEFIGLRCFNGLRLVQLSILGYSFNVLEGAFVTSSESSRRVLVHSSEHEKSLDHSHHRCVGCSIKKDSLLSSIMESELKRVAKTAVLWTELQTAQLSQ